MAEGKRRVRVTYTIEMAFEIPADWTDEELRRRLDEGVEVDLPTVQDDDLWDALGPNWCADYDINNFAADWFFRRDDEGEDEEAAEDEGGR